MPDKKPTIDSKQKVSCVGARRPGKSKTDDSTCALPFGVFKGTNNRFFGSVNIYGQTKFLGHFSSPFSASDAARIRTGQAVPAQRVTYSGI
jgi:hypothetical protein